MLQIVLRAVLLVVVLAASAWAKAGNVVLVVGSGKGLYAVTADSDLFTRNDFTACAPDEVPWDVRASSHFAQDAGAGAGVLRKLLE